MSTVLAVLPASRVLAQSVGEARLPSGVPLAASGIGHVPGGRAS